MANQSATTLDAAFAELQDCELRIDSGSAESDQSRDLASRASELFATIQSQLTSLEAQRDRLATLLGSLPQLPR
jgi:hypothetical protein